MLFGLVVMCFVCFSQKTLHLFHQFQGTAHYFQRVDTEINDSKNHFTQLRDDIAMYLHNLFPSKGLFQPIPLLCPSLCKQ